MSRLIGGRDSRLVGKQGDPDWQKIEKGMKTGFQFFKFWFIFCLVGGLGFFGFIIWAIYKVVTSLAH